MQAEINRLLISSKDGSVVPVTISIPRRVRCVPVSLSKLKSSRHTSTSCPSSFRHVAARVRHTSRAETKLKSQQYRHTMLRAGCRMAMSSSSSSRSHLHRHRQLHRLTRRYHQHQRKQHRSARQVLLFHPHFRLNRPQLSRLVPRRPFQRLALLLRHHHQRHLRRLPYRQRSRRLAHRSNPLRPGLATSCPARHLSNPTMMA